MGNKNFIITEENVEKYSNKIGSWIKQIVEKAKASGVVLGMSGGVDCSTVARLCQIAGVDVHLILMPYGSDMTNSTNYSDVMELINKFKFNYHIFDIKPAVDSIQISSDSGMLRNAKKENIKLSKANIKPRIRMTYLYQYAQINNLLVIGTSNLSERVIGYFTKWGDGASDFNPLGMLTKREVYILAKYLKIPKCIITKTPSADLWKGQTDEQELGIAYEQIDNFILNGSSNNQQIDNLIKIKQEKAKHKLYQIPVFEE